MAAGAVVFHEMPSAAATAALAALPRPIAHLKVGLGRILVLYYRASASYQIH
jgi:hypothetical protein